MLWKIFTDNDIILIKGHHPEYTYNGAYSLNKKDANDPVENRQRSRE